MPTYGTISTKRASQIIQSNGIIEKSFSASTFIVFTVINVVLAYLSKQSALFSTTYSICVLLIGLYFLIRDKNPSRLIYICGYLVGAELIWRSTGASIFYEFGKYSIIFLLSLALIKYNLFWRATKWPLLYFVLLLPSIVLVPSFNREIISFFLSGPLLLAVSTMFFSAVYITPVQVKKILIMIIGPTIGIAFLAILNTFNTEEIIFTTESNFVTSGGFGPVQISLQLAFGGLLAFYYAIVEKKKYSIIFLIVPIATWLMSQSIFTFSRSGLYNAGVSLLIFFLFYLRNGSQRIKLLLFSLIAILFVVLIAFPIMDRFTNGMLTIRFQDTSVTSRRIMVMADLQAFRESPFFGVGPGGSSQYYLAYRIYSSPHTEYSRLMAEHGSLGLISMFIMLGLAGKRLFAKTSPDQKSFQLLMTVWALSYLIDTTMRTASPGFAFGLGAALFISDEVLYREAEHTSCG